MFIDRSRWLVAFAVALLLAACARATLAVPTPTEVKILPTTLPKNADGYADITVQQLAAMLENKSFVLVNTHIPYEGEIAQTDLFIPYNQVTEHLNELPADKDAPIVLYCRRGNMSTIAAKQLVALGYTNVMELDGGFMAWKAAGYELLDRR
jgi:rhodanese-related sulfurtransferase